MSEQKKNKGTSLLKRWKQAISHFITFCLYGDQSPLDRASAKRMRADISHKVEPENEHVRGHTRNILH